MVEIPGFEPRLCQPAELIPRDLPVPVEGKYDFSYIAQVKDYLRQARDLVKFIPQTSGASAEIEAEATRIIRETETADKEILH